VNALRRPVFADSSLLVGLEELVKIEVTSGTAWGERVEEGQSDGFEEAGICVGDSDLFILKRTSFISLKCWCRDDCEERSNVAKFKVAEIVAALESLTA